MLPATLVGDHRDSAGSAHDARRRFFYGGLVKAKSVVSMMMMSFGSIGLVAVLWILFGSR